METPTKDSNFGDINHQKKKHREEMQISKTIAGGPSFMLVFRRKRE